MELELKVGKKYRTREGKEFIVASVNIGSITHPAYCSDGEWRALDGSYNKYEPGSYPEDAVEEVAEDEVDVTVYPPATPEERAIHYKLERILPGRGDVIFGQMKRNVKTWFQSDYWPRLLSGDMGITSLFIWSETPEGHDYWSAISKEWDVHYIPPKDPETVAPFSTARKDDVKDGKVGRHYWHPRTLDAGQLAHEAGAVKYDPLNFMKGHETTQLLDAAIRHIEKHIWEGDLDEDCTRILGRPVDHLGCALACINMVFAQRAAGTHRDNRKLELRNPKREG